MNALEIQALNSDAVNPDRHKLDNLQPLFLRGEDDIDYCKIINMHDQGKNDITQVVNPSHIQRWPRLWKAYQQGRDNDPQTGTPLRDVPGMDQAMALVYRLRGIHNAEALARAEDTMLESIGMGGLAMRRNAQLLLRANEADELKAKLAAQTAPADLPAVTDADIAAAAHAARVQEVKDKQQGARK